MVTVNRRLRLKPRSLMGKTRNWTHASNNCQRSTRPATRMTLSHGRVAAAMPAADSGRSSPRRNTDGSLDIENCVSGFSPNMSARLTSTKERTTRSNVARNPTNRRHPLTLPVHLSRRRTMTTSSGATTGTSGTSVARMRAIASTTPRHDLASLGLAIRSHIVRANINSAARASWSPQIIQAAARTRMAVSSGPVASQSKTIEMGYSSAPWTSSASAAHISGLPYGASAGRVRCQIRKTAARTRSISMALRAPMV